MGHCESTKKNTYHCQRGHPLQWQGAKFIERKGMICNKCKHYSSLERPIRWRCIKCNLYFCSVCYENIISEKCPLGHDFQIRRNDPVYFVCDKCYQAFPPFSSKFSDIFCNITYCYQCFYEHINYSKQNQ